MNRVTEWLREFVDDRRRDVELAFGIRFHFLAQRRVLLPLALMKAANYPWLYGTVCLSPSIAGSVAKVEGKVLDREGKVRKATAGTRRTLEESKFVLWSGGWELFDLPPGTYTLELTAIGKDGTVLTSRKERFLHGDPPANQGEGKP